MATFRLKKIKKYIKNIPFAIETGTFKGDGTRQMAQIFNKVITIELDKDLHKKTKNKLDAEGFRNITFIQGDSGEELKKVINEIEKPAMFFLDAHWSGDDSVDWNNSTWEGYGVNTSHLGKQNVPPSSQEQVPLDREINAISKHFKHRGIIYIDDLDKFSSEGKGLRDIAFKGEDYSHINLNHLKKILGKRVTLWKKLKSDQLLIKIGAIPTNKKEETIQNLKHKFSRLFR